LACKEAKKKKIEASLIGSLWTHLQACNWTVFPVWLVHVVLCLAFSLTLKTEAVHLSKHHFTVQCHISDANNLNSNTVVLLMNNKYTQQYNISII
jgi:hypothetical protein